MRVFTVFVIKYTFFVYIVTAKLDDFEQKKNITVFFNCSF